MPAPIVFLDLDDCLLGPIWPTPDRPRRPVNRAVASEIIALLHRYSVSAHFLTNRPPGQLAPLAQFIGGPARYHMAESGLSAWIPDQNTGWINPRYEDFARRIRPQIIARLSERFGLAPEGPVVEELGTRLVSVTVFPLGGTRADVHRLAEQVRELLADLPVDVKVGKGVDISPAGASKLDACIWAEELHRRLHGEKLDWARVLYVDDSTTALKAAAYIAERGGTVAAVANAADELKRLAADAGGILAQASGEAGVLEALRAWLEQ